MKRIYSNDIDLIKDLKKGSSKAYTFLVDSYHHKLCVYAFSLTHDDDLSEDIVQNVFVYVWKNRSKLKDDFKIKSYLYRSVYNEFIDQYRKRKAVTVLEKKYIDALNTVVEREDDNSFEKLISIVKVEINNLPPKCKEIFLLSKQEGLTNIEIAEYLGVSIKSVESHITKAFKKLREKLDDKVDLFMFLLFDVQNQRVKIF